LGRSSLRNEVNCSSSSDGSEQQTDIVKKSLKNVLKCEKKGNSGNAQIENFVKSF
jgi:hypothetical protein